VRYPWNARQALRLSRDVNTMSPQSEGGREASGQEDCLRSVREQAFVLYHRRSPRPEEWHRLGTYQTVEAARKAASEHGYGLGSELNAWIMEHPSADEWRLIAGGHAYKVERVLTHDPEQSNPDQ
jgi:hypothetical protein